MKKAVAVLGHINIGECVQGGQTVKTFELYSALIDEFGKENVFALDTKLLRKNPILFFVKLLKAFFTCRCVIMLPAQNGVKLFAPICMLFKKLLKIKIHYSIIGAWLPEKLKNEPRLIKNLACFDSLWAETSTMKTQLEKVGLKNVCIVRNFKKLQAAKKGDLKKVNSPVRLCTFSRVLKEKGIEDAINAAKELQNEVILDIYGNVADGYSEKFEDLKSSFPENIKYKGCIQHTESVNILKGYDLQLFPTHYATEGVPGAIIDSYFAGVPVLASRWNSFSDVVWENETGVGFELGNYEDFLLKLKSIINNPEKIYEMKLNCLEKSKLFSKEEVIKKIKEIIL